jgi:hypothetical protein
MLYWRYNKLVIVWGSIQLRVPHIPGGNIDGVVNGCLRRFAWQLC